MLGPKDDVHQGLTRVCCESSALLSSCLQAPVVGFALQFTPGPDQPLDSVHSTQAALQQARMLPQTVQQGWPAGYVPAPGPCAAGGEADLAGCTANLAAHRMLSPTLLR